MFVIVFIERANLVGQLVILIVEPVILDGDGGALASAAHCPEYTEANRIQYHSKGGQRLLWSGSISTRITVPRATV